MDLNGMVDKIFEDRMEVFSPVTRLRGDTFARHRSVTTLFPTVLLMHGTADNTVPDDQSTDFAMALRGLDVSVTVKRYSGKSHTDPIIEDLMFYDNATAQVSEKPSLMLDIVKHVRGNTVRTNGRRRAPSVLVDALNAPESGILASTARLLCYLARIANPF
jgi:acetyl esterase/lipase